MRSFHFNAAIENDSKYKTGFFGVYVIFFPNGVLAQMDPNSMATFSSAKISISCAREAALRLHKILVNVIWDSYVLRTS